mmetsp:Transcript_49463/g.127465  ORF Transcript_49463/g.127465 Transcript_49463/m.127465 type:complete len:202 (+) Transcript_49463:818-1423(+)
MLVMALLLSDKHFSRGMSVKPSGRRRSLFELTMSLSREVRQPMAEGSSCSLLSFTTNSVREVRDPIVRGRKRTSLLPRCSRSSELRLPMRGDTSVMSLWWKERSSRWRKLHTTVGRSVSLLWLIDSRTIFLKLTIAEGREVMPFPSKSRWVRVVRFCTLAGRCCTAFCPSLSSPSDRICATPSGISRRRLRAIDSLLTTVR